MVILGIDPGETLIGIGVVKKSGSKIEYIGHECITIASEKKTEEKLFEIDEKMAEILERHKPDAIGIESLFFFKNLKTAIRVAQARGVLLLACQKKNLKIWEFTPLQVKQAVACYGRAEKKQVQNMVKAILELSEIPKPDDAADALAVAICAANTSEVLIK
ncbi:crossover junction endodeoxyribonuclease RuvC [Candidatus Azambacteria bacterium]|nr:crossover junction endodeoxyribonuclease RuvC [Candidatus Azambacteria bacterium]